MGEQTRAKTPLFLQRALVEELKKITSDMRFHQPKSNVLVPLSVYAQTLPIPVKDDSQNPEEFNTIDCHDGGEEETVFKCPWCLVKIDNGIIPGPNEMQQLEVGICFGVFNDSLENQGHQEVLNLIQKVYERFAVNPILDDQYTCQGEFEWALQDEDTYPYFFGAIGTSFKFCGFRRENKYL